MSTSNDDTLVNKKCVPCHGGVTALTLAEAQKKLGLLEGGWNLVEDGKALKREFKFPDFYRAMSFYETVLVPGYYRSGEGRKEGALRMLRVLRAPGPVPYTWRPPRTEDT